MDMPVSAAIAAPRARRPARRSRLDAVVLADEHAVRDDAVEVHVEVERPAEALHEGDRACAGADRSSLARHPAPPGEDPAQSDAEGATDRDESRPRKQLPISRLEWSRQPDLNRRPTVYETVALPTELCRPGSEGRCF